MDLNPDPRAEEMVTTMTSGGFGDLVLFYRRRQALLGWHWTLELHHDGIKHHVAAGTVLRQRQIKPTAQSWARIWMRHNGLL